MATGVEESLNREVRVGMPDHQSPPSGGLLDVATRQRLVAGLESDGTRYKDGLELAADKLDIDAKTFAGIDSPELQEMIQRILEGSEPLDRPLHPWEPKRFNAAHVNIILMRAAGFKPGELAEMLGFDRSRISVILKHPYANRLLALLLPLAAKSAMNTRARLDTYASRMLDRVYQVGIESEDEQVVTRIGFGLIDRSSFAPTRQAEIHHKHTLSAPAASITRLSAALDESRELDRQITPDYTILPAGEGDAAQDGSSPDLASDGLARSSDEPPIGNPLSQHVA